MRICQYCMQNGMCSGEPCYIGSVGGFGKFLDYISVTALNGQPTRCANYKLVNILRRYKAEKEATELRRNG